MNSVMRDRMAAMDDLAVACGGRPRPGRGMIFTSASWEVFTARIMARADARQDGSAGVPVFVASGCRAAQPRRATP